MHPFTPSAPIKDFFEALNAASKRGLVWGDIPGRFQYVRYALPPIPPEPAGEMELAFFQNICMPAYNAMAAANQRANDSVNAARSATTPSAPSYSVYDDPALYAGSAP